MFETPAQTASQWHLFSTSFAVVEHDHGSQPHSICVVADDDTESKGDPWHWHSLMFFHVWLPFCFSAQFTMVASDCKVACPPVADINRMASEPQENSPLRETRTANTLTLIFV